MKIRRMFVGLGLTVAATSGLTAGPSTAPADAGSGQYVALGDSYSAGTGAGSYTLQGSCSISSNAYPALYAADHPGQSFDFDACPGAVTGDVLKSQLGDLGDATSLVTITIGGNDVGFANLMATCSLGTDKSCLDAIASAETKGTTDLPPKLDATYAAIRAHAPNARVVVLGYPKLFAEGPAWCTMSQTKRAALNDGVGILNGVIKDRAEAAGMQFESPVDEFAGHGICSSNPWINGLVWLNVGTSFHPNKTGQANGYYAALKHALS